MNTGSVQDVLRSNDIYLPRPKRLSSIYGADLRHKEQIMAKVKLNKALKAMWGRVGKLVYRRSSSGETYLSVAPDMSRVKWSPAQKEHRQRFKQAIADAKAALEDPEVRAHYEIAAKQAGKRTFDLAVSEHYHKQMPST